MKKKMIKNLMLVVAMVVLCLAVGMTASAERAVVDSGECGAEGDNVIWTLYGDGELVISGEGEMASYSSSSDGPWNEYSWDIIKSVVIEEGITGVGNVSFNTQAERISLPDSLNSIGSYNCFGSKYYQNPENWKDGALYIGNHLITVDETITNFVIPDNVICVAGDAFESSNIVNITIGKNVRNITLHAFDVMFWNCMRLETISVHKDNPYFSCDENGVLFNKDKTKLIRYPVANKNTEYIIPDTVNELGEGAFAYSLYLKKVVLPESLKSLPDYAFMQAYSLSSINLEYIEFIGEGGITMCALDEITIPANMKQLDSGAILMCYFLDKIYVKSMDVEIAELALNVLDCYYKDITKDEFVAMYLDAILNGSSDIWEYEVRFAEGMGFLSTVYCHEGSTAQEQAELLGIKYELTHFFEGEWLYDAENKYCYRQCIHCDEREISEDIGDVEIEAPVIPDTDFTVDVIEDYVVIEETISNNITTDFEIVKAFDINLKNKDGVHVQPDGTVKVKLPNDWSKEGAYKVYRVNDDGTLTDMKAYREGSHLVFETDHFSVYVIVVEDEAESAPDEPQEETKLSFFERLANLIRAFFDMIKALFGN